MGGRHSLPGDRLIIFCRYPVPGRTKTRIIPALGPAGAADLHRRLTEKTMATVREFASRRGIKVEVRFEGGSERKMCRWLGSGTIFSAQKPGVLGDRMHAAFLDAFKSGARRVVLLGTDVPKLRTTDLAQAFDALKEQDLVLGPSTDGGYWLIGLKHPAQVFQSIDWGSETVLEQTVALAKRQDLAVHTLDSLTDIDTAKELKQWRPEEANPRPYISIIIPVLNEACNIEAAVRSARDEDTEIIVVDGGSADDTVARAADAGARVEACRQGRALQQNRGAEAARGKVLLFLHADTRLPRDYVGHVFETLMDPTTAAGAFRFKSDLDRPLMKLIEFLTNFRSRHLNMPYGDQGLFMRKEVFESVGGFSDVLIAEDLFLVRRLSKRGRVRIAPADAVTSARRWRTLGLLRATLVNQLIVAGCYLGISPHTLASIYRPPSNKQK